MEQQQQQRKSLGYLSITSSMLVDLEEDSDDVLDPKSTLMHSDLATITESSALNDDDDLTLSSLGSSVHPYQAKTTTPSANKKYTASTSRKYSDLMAFQVIKEVDNESQSASSFSGRLDKMESQLAQLSQKKGSQEDNVPAVHSIEQEPLDEHDPKQIDKKNINTYDYDDSSTITSMQSTFRTNKPVVFFQCPTLTEAKEQHTPKDIIYDASPPDGEQSKSTRRTSFPKEIYEESLHYDSQDEEPYVVPEEKEIIQEQKLKQLPQNENLKENRKKEQASVVTTALSLAPTTLNSSVDEEEEYKLHHEETGTIKKLPVQQNQEMILTTNTDPDIVKKEKRKRKCITQYTVIILLVIAIIGLSNALTRYISKDNSTTIASTSTTIAKDDPTMSTNISNSSLTHSSTDNERERDGF